MADNSIHIGCDIGGTFTDIVAQLADGTLHVRKVASTPDNPGQAVVDGLSELLGDVGAVFSDVREVVHGTTVGSNTILQKSGARTGLITTRGFRDVLEIGRIRTPNVRFIVGKASTPCAEASSARGGRTHGGRRKVCGPIVGRRSDQRGRDPSGGGDRGCCNMFHKLLH